MARGQAALEVKVGVFVFLLMALTVTVILLLGRTSQLFQEQLPLKTSFKTASGLRVGAQVRLAGVIVGQVAGIHFGADPRDPKVTVELKVAKEMFPRITTASRARIDSMGLLGDKIIDISVGQTGDPVPAGHMLDGEAPPEYLQLLDTAQSALKNVQDISFKLRDVVGRYSDPKVHEDVAGILSGTRRLVEQIGTGRGLVHALLFDKKLAIDVRGIIARTGANFSQVTKRFGEAGLALTKAFGEVGNILKAVRKAKDSTVSKLLYGKDQVTPIFQAAKQAAEKLVTILDKIGKGGGLLSALTEDKRGKEVVENFVKASRSVKELGESLRDVGRSVAEGKGTIGALLHDPSIYEDLKQTVGNLRRNRVLRALIRYAIERREQPPPPAQPRPAAK